LSAASGGAGVKKELGGEVEFFSVPVELGPEGVAAIHPIGKLTEFEQGLIKAALPELQGNISKGVEFVQTPKL